MEDRVLLATFTVTNTADAGEGSLRQAILDANANPGADVIVFDIPGAGVRTIAPMTELPAIEESVLIDGWSQPGFVGTPLIELSGQNNRTGDFGNGLLITGSGVQVRGLAINRIDPGFTPGFSLTAAIHITGLDATGNWIYGNVIGTDPTGTVALPNRRGVVISSGASGNVIGTNGDGVDDDVEGNLISASDWRGVVLTGWGTEGNVVAGNRIGTDITGTRALPNFIGLMLIGGANRNRIGTDGDGLSDTAERNLISGNSANSIQIIDASENRIAGNFIGTDATGANPLGNGGNGIFLEYAAANMIGGTETGAGNLIAYNGAAGVFLQNESTGNSILGNRIFANAGPAIARSDGHGGAAELRVRLRPRPEDQLLGQVVGAPDTSYLVELFASSEPHPSGVGEAQEFLGAVTVTTGPDGRAAFAASLAVPEGLPVLSATLTDPAGWTSAVLANPQPTLGPIADLRLLDSAGPYRLALRGWSAGSDLGDPPLTVTVESSDPGLLSHVAVQPPGAGLATGWLQVEPRPGRLGVTVLTVTLDDGDFRVTRSFTVTVLSSLVVEPNNTPALAIPILDSDHAAAGETRWGTTTADDPDLFRFDVAEPSSLFAGVQAHSGETRLSLLDEGGHDLVQSLRADADRPGGAITQHLLPGRYYLKVEGLDPQPVEYLLTTRLRVGSEPGDFIPFPDLGWSAAGPVVSDLDGDGILDVLFTHGTQAFALLSHGDGTFAFERLVSELGRDVLWTPGLVLGDINADGFDDLVFVGFDPNASWWTYQIYTALNQGDGTFAAAVPVRSDLQTSPDLKLVDINQDGILDIISVGSGDGSVLIGLGRGDGTFHDPIWINIGGEPGAFDLGDLNGDGILDLVVAIAGQPTVRTFQWADGQLVEAAAPPNTVPTFLGRGDGTFQHHETITDERIGTNRRWSFVALRDVNGNGHLDIALDSGIEIDLYIDFFGSQFHNGNYHERLGHTVLIGRGDTSFEEPYLAPEEFDSGFDFDGDGRLDWLRYDSSSRLALVLSGREANGQPPIPLPFGGGYFGRIQGFAFGDFNGDGRIDIVGSTFSEAHEAGAKVLLGRGDGTFTGTDATVTIGWGSAFADFNGDGRMDLVTHNKVFLGRDDGTFDDLGDRFKLDTDFLGVGWTVADLNGDGRLDLFGSGEVRVREGPFGDNRRGYQVLLGRGDGTFLTLPFQELPYKYPEIMLGDVTGDGHLDLVTFFFDDGVLQVYRGRGDGTFAELITSLEDLPDMVVRGLADINGDGHLDVIASHVYWRSDISDQGTLYLFHGRGDGTFHDPVPIKLRAGGGQDPANNIRQLAIIDLNRDGHLDLVADLWSQSGPATLAVFLNDGHGSFTEIQSFHPEDLGLPSDPPVGYWGSFFVEEDDDRVSLVSSYSFSDDPFGPFTPLFTLTWEGGQVADGPTVRLLDLDLDLDLDPFRPLVALHDLNEDGRLDLLIQQTTGEVRYWLDAGDEGFIAADQIVIEAQTRPLLVDLDGDGAPDLVITDDRGRILWRQGRAEDPGGYEPPRVVNPDRPARSIAFVATAAGPILAAADYRGDAVSLYAWRDGRFERVGHLAAGGAFPDRLLAADLDGTGRDDLVWLNPGSGTLTVARADPFGNFHVLGQWEVGFGVSDLTALDVDRDGRSDLVLTYRDTGHLVVLRSLGDGRFAPPQPYRAGAGPYWLGAASNEGARPIQSWEKTSAVTTIAGARPSLAVLNPGTHSFSVLVGLEGGAYANPHTYHLSFAPVGIRSADFNRDGHGDLAVLGPDRVLIYLGDGRGGFVQVSSIGAGVEPTGLTIADFDGDGLLDLLVGNSFGDILPLIGNGDGTFKPFQTLQPHIALAVADLNGDGLDDFVFANQALERVLVQYGGQTDAGPVVIQDRSDGLLAPGAVHLADLNGNGIDDLIVVNSGGNNLLIYPGLGDGTFGPALNDGRGVAVGTNPASVTLADLTGNGRTDLVVTNTGSNDVSIILNQSQGDSWSLVAGPRLQTDAGLVAAAVADIDGNGRLDLVVSNSQAGTVQWLPGVGGGFFDDRNPRTVAVGPQPGPVFVGSFTGGPSPEIVTLNTGSNSLTLIAGLATPAPQVSQITTGGIQPVAALAGDFNNDGRTDLFVAHGGDSRYTLLMSGSTGLLSVASSLTLPDLARPTSVALAGPAGPGLVSFYVATAGREVAARIVFGVPVEGVVNRPIDGPPWLPGLPSIGLPIGGGPGHPLDLRPPELPSFGEPFRPPLDSPPGDPGFGLGPTPSFGGLPVTIVAPVGGELLERLVGLVGEGAIVAQFVPLDELALALVATLLTDSVTTAESVDAALLAELLGEGLLFINQELTLEESDDTLSGTEEPDDDAADPQDGEDEQGEADDLAQDPPSEPTDEESASPLERFLLGLDEALERSWLIADADLDLPAEDSEEVGLIPSAVDAALEGWSDPVEDTEVDPEPPLLDHTAGPRPDSRPEDVPLASAADREQAPPLVAPSDLPALTVALLFATAMVRVLTRHVRPRTRNQTTKTDFNPQARQRGVSRRGRTRR